MADQFLLRVMAQRDAEQVAACDCSSDTSEAHRMLGRLGGRPPTLKRAILLAMGGGQTVTALSLSRELSHGRKAVASALHRLLDEGRVRKVAYGVFALPEAKP